MFERFSDQARRVLVLAQEEARRLDHLQISDELLLIGLAAQPDATAGRALEELGATADQVRERIPAAVDDGRKKHHSGGHIPFTPSAKKVLEGALSATTESGSLHLGTEHLLIGLIKVDGVGVRVLRELGVDVDELRNRMAAAADAGNLEETQATPWSAPRADTEAQFAWIESTLHQILARLTAIEKRLPEQ